MSAACQTFTSLQHMEDAQLAFLLLWMAQSSTAESTST